MVQLNLRPDRKADLPVALDGPTAAALRLDFIVRRPAWSQPLSVFIILSLIGLVALSDLATGPHLSIRVFYDIPVILSIVWLGWWAGVLTCAGCVSGLYAVGLMEHAEFTKTPLVYWNLPLTFALYFVVAGIVQAFVLLHRELEHRVKLRTLALEQSMLVREELQRELLFSSERERTLIGQDLHDGLCQHLVATTFAAQVLTERLAQRSAPCAQEARGIVRLIEEGVMQTRQIARGLLLTAIPPERLAVELEEFAAAISRQSNVPCRFLAEGTPQVTDEQIASQLFRIAQESVRNALRHARPTSIEIVLTTDGSFLTLMVSDDGVGLNSAPPGQGGVGLRIMNHRAAILDGELNIEHGHDGGTVVRCRVPARAAAI